MAQRQSKVQPKQNTFHKGLNLDSHPQYQPEGTYRYALNARTGTSEWDHIGLTNEQSTIPASEYMGDIHGMTLIEERDQWIVFHTQGGNSTISLLHTETGKVTKVISEDEFGCDWDFQACEYIYAEMKTMELCRELFIYFSSKCKYYVINVDEMLDPQRRWCRICDDFCLFICACVPELNAYVASQAGGSLRTGAYQFAAQLQDRDGHSTNWFWVTEPISIKSETNQAGSLSKNTINVTVENLDPRYEQVNIAVVKTVDNTTTAEIITERGYNTNGITLLYYGQKGKDIQFEELLTKRRTWLEGKDLIQKDGKLFLYNIKQRRNLDYQARAMNIKVRGLIMAVRAQDAWKYKTLVRGERYAFAIRWNYCDASHTVGFHIPAGLGAGTPAPRRAGEVGRGIQVLVERALRNTGLNDGRFGDRSFDKGEFQQPDSPHKPRPLREVIDNSNTAFDRADALMNQIEFECDDCGDNAELIINGNGGGGNGGEGNGGGNEDGSGARNTRNPDDDEYLPENNEPSTKNEAKSWIKNWRNKIIGGDDLNNENFFGAVTRAERFPPKQDPPFNLEDFPKLEGNSEVYVLDKIDLEPWLSEETYPDQKNCEGEQLYGTLEGNPIRHFQIPDETSIPHVISFSNGVVSRYSREATEWDNAYVLLIGLEVSNIEFPNDDELHTPLCAEMPYSIVMAERTEVNSHIVAKGLATHTFGGIANGRVMAFPKHAVNSIEFVDRFIRAGTDGNSRKGFPLFSNYIEQNPGLLPLFNFHSADTSLDKPGLLVDNVDFMGTMSGHGFRHGLYALGNKPRNAWARQIDQRGTRQSINLFNFITNKAERAVNGISYVRGNSTLTAADGIDLPLVNLFRESSVAFQADEMPPVFDYPSDGWPASASRADDPYTDQSFIGDSIDHTVPVNASAAHYAVLKRNNPSQYGSVHGIRYIDTGLHAKPGRSGTVSGIVGDAFIGPWTIKRTSYVSNKVGERRIVPSKKEVATWIYNMFGIGDHTRPPRHGDDEDVKNLACLRPGESHSGFLNPVTSEPPADDYYPRTLKTLVVFWGEFRTNPWLRARGDLQSEVYYDNLADLTLDSSLGGGDWTLGWLNRFYDEVKRAARWKIILRVILRFLIIFLGAFYIIKVGMTMNSIIDFGVIFRIVTLVALYVAALIIFSVYRLNVMLGIDETADETRGGQDDSDIKQWEDNYYEYDSTHSLPNKLTATFGMPNPYYTCDCDDCINDETTNEIFLSDKQVMGSPIDAYRNFQANSYLQIPSHSGKLIKLFIRNSQLFAHTTDNIWILQYSQTQRDFDNPNLFLDNSGLLIQPDEFMEHVPEGFGGLRHWSHSINTISGYYFMDEKARKVFRFGGFRDIEDLSMMGTRNFFKENMRYCNSHNCIGEAAPQGAGYALGYDHRHNRVFLSKRDPGDNDASWTLSYDPARKAWISFHSYVPQFFKWTRRGMYSVKDGRVWLHDANECNYQTFYDKYYPFIVEFVSKHPSLIPGELNHVSFYSQANICTQGIPRVDVYNQKYTFNKGIFYNNTQCSGEIELIPRWDGIKDTLDLRDQIIDRPLTAPIDWQGEEWRVNQIRDLTKDITKPIWLLDPCTREKTLNHDNIDITKTTMKQNIVFDRYLANRLIFDNFDKVQLIVSYGITYDNIPTQ